MPRPYPAARSVVHLTRPCLARPQSFAKPRLPTTGGPSAIEIPLNYALCSAIEDRPLHPFRTAIAPIGCIRPSSLITPLPARNRILEPANSLLDPAQGYIAAQPNPSASTPQILP